MEPPRPAGRLNWRALLATLTAVAMIGTGCDWRPAPTSPTGSTATSSPSPGSRPAPGRTPAQEWSQRADAPTALTEVAAAALEGRIWVIGGLDASGSAVRAVQIYDPRADSWSGGPELPRPIHHATLVSTGSALLLIGGYEGSSFGQPSLAVWRLDGEARRWLAGPDLPEPRGAGAAAWDGRRVLFGGGVGPDGTSDRLYALEGSTWSPLGRLSTDREHLAATSDMAGTTWFFAGRSGGLAANRQTVDRVSGSEVSRAAALRRARGGIAAFWSPLVGACVVGGEEESGTIESVECIGPDGRIGALPSLRTSRHGLGAAIVDGVAYALLGGPRPGLTVSAIVEALAIGP